LRRKDEPGGGDWREAERAERRVCLPLPWDLSKTALISVVADAFKHALSLSLSLSLVFNREKKREREKEREKGKETRDRRKGRLYQIPIQRKEQSRATQKFNL